MLTYKMVFILMSLYGQYQCSQESNDTEADLERRWGRTNDSRPVFTYAELYRDHLYSTLSDNARDIFYPLEIHPRCIELKGQCIPRGKCIGKKMLYLSRVCYTRDLVCCYDDTIRFPTVEIITKPLPVTEKTTTEEGAGEGEGGL